MSRLLGFIAASVLAAVLAAPAHAQQTYAPPGNSGLGQYLEIVPGAGGNRPAGGGGAGGGGGGSQTTAGALGSQTAAQLNALGKDGQAAAQVAAAGTSGTDAGLRRSSKRSSKSGGAKDLGSAVKPGQSIATSDDGGRARSIARAIAGDGGGMGLLFPILLAAALLAAITLVGVRRRARRGGPGAT